MRLGIFGGTFDPIHYGHLLLAESCREQCQLDEVWFMPAATPPHKRHAELTAARHRIDMLELAIGGQAAFRVATREIDRGGVSYTFETLEGLTAERPDDELFFLLGADSLRDLPTWRRPDRILESSTLVVVRRASSPEPDLASLDALVPAGGDARLRARHVVMPLVEFSSRDLRARVAAGRSIRFRTPRAVEQYIREHGLYRASDESASGNA